VFQLLTDTMKYILTSSFFGHQQQNVVEM